MLRNNDGELVGDLSYVGWLYKDIIDFLTHSLMAKVGI